MYYQTDYFFTGSVQTFTAPVDGWYYLKCWGAPGGVAKGGKADACAGGYAEGLIYCKASTSLDVWVGNNGKYWSGKGENNSAGWPDGGAMKKGNAYGGGGSTSITIHSSTATTYDSQISNRIMVAGGGDGYHCSGHPGTQGGGFFTQKTNTGLSGATQTSGYEPGHGQDSYVASGGAGGGGYWGGFAAKTAYSGGSGGSGYVSGYAVGNNVCATHSSGIKFHQANMVNGRVTAETGKAECLLVQRGGSPDDCPNVTGRSCWCDD